MGALSRQAGPTSHERTGQRRPRSHCYPLGQPTVHADRLAARRRPPTTRRVIPGRSRAALTASAALRGRTVAKYDRFWLPSVSRRGWKSGSTFVLEPGVWLLRSAGIVV